VCVCRLRTLQTRLGIWGFWIWTLYYDTGSESERIDFHMATTHVSQEGRTFIAEPGSQGLAGIGLLMQQV
jgi:hypothetical protein